MKMDQNFRQKLSLLKLYYAYLLNLLDVFCGGYIVHADENINRVYLVLINKIESILQSEKFSELYKDYERPFSSLLCEQIKEADIYWTDGSIGERMRDFYSKIEEIFIKNNEKPLPIERLTNKKDVEDDIKMVKATIEILKEWAKEDKVNIEKTVMELKDKIPFLEVEKESSVEKVEFIDSEAILKAGDTKCQLPPFQNEHFFCRAAFEYMANEVIDWSVIYEKMTGYYEKYYGKPMESRENWRIVYDAMEALNNRVEKGLGIDKLFIWQEKTVKRIQ